MPVADVKKIITPQWTNGIKVLRDLQTHRVLPVRSIMNLRKDDLFPNGTERSAFKFQMVGTGIFMINAKCGEALPPELKLRCDSALSGMVDLWLRVPEKQVGKSVVLFFRHEQGSGKKAPLAKTGGYGEEGSVILQLSIENESLEVCRMPGEGEKFAYDILQDRFVIVKEISKQQLELLPLISDFDPFKRLSVSYFILGLQDSKWVDAIFPLHLSFSSQFPLVDAKL